MTLKQEVHALIDAFPEDAASLGKLRERLRLDLALAQALKDVDEGRTLDETAFLREVANRWPAPISA